MGTVWNSRRRNCVAGCFAVSGNHSRTRSGGDPVTLDDVSDLALAGLWAAVGIVTVFALYSYLSPRIQKPTAGSQS